MKRFVYCSLGLSLALAAGSCGEDGGLDVPDAFQQCLPTCPGDEGPDGVEVKGVLEGNAAISGVAQVDAFFAAVNNFRGAADGVSAGIDAELDKIRADFELGANAELAAGIRAKIMANVEGSLVIDYQPARCAVDARATVEANARCEAQVTPANIEVACKGSCELEAGAKLECDASADLQCTFTGPTVDCKGECSGTCDAKLEVAAACSGTCRGMCTGNCSAYSDSGATQCAGACDGMCMGNCEAKAEAGVKCTGTCRGECTLTGPDAMCTGSARASCQAKANAMVMCKGKCEGEFEPPTASAECKATARAEAKINVQCTPPSIQARYRLRAVASADVMAQARFEAALNTLIRVRLPALVSATARAKSVAEAGADLGDAAGVAVKASIKTARGDAGIRVKYGLVCALTEIDEVGMAIEDSGAALNDSLRASATITAMLGMN